MYDPQYHDFQGRLQRVEELQRTGRAFEAPGTLGAARCPRGVVARVAARRMPLWRSLGVIALMVILVKATILAQVGAATYAERLALSQGRSTVERVATWVMQVDPMTAWLAERIAGFIALGR